MAVMRDPAATTFTFVLHPEAVAIKETRRAIAELGKLGITNHQLIVNSVIPPEARTNPLFAARAEMQTRYLAQITQELPVPTRTMALLPGEIKGAKRLRAVGAIFFDGADSASFGQNGATPAPSQPCPRWTAWLSACRPTATAGGLFAGKGGVGKTVASCITAVWLARQGHKTLLLTTDPAAHLGDVLGVPVGDTAEPVDGVPNLWAAKIDPKAAADSYKQRILDDARQRGRPEQAIQAMEEELDSPCTEEMAAFDLFIDFASQAQWDSIVFDTAPTGHTLRLLELPMDWSKQIDVKVFASVDTSRSRRRGQAALRPGDRHDARPGPQHLRLRDVPRVDADPGGLPRGRGAAHRGHRAGLVVANFVIPAEEATTPFTQARRAMQEHYLARSGMFSNN
jgi:arsenite/tail-anchored protein-transporting ATPase